MALDRGPVGRPHRIQKGPARPGDRDHLPTAIFDAGLADHMASLFQTVDQPRDIVLGQKQMVLDFKRAQSPIRRTAY